MKRLHEFGVRACCALFAFASALAQAPAQVPAQPAPVGETTAPVRKVDPRSEFHIKYVGDGVVYLDGGRNAGLTEKMKLTVHKPAAPGPAGGNAALQTEQASSVGAELEIFSVADNSAVCLVKSSSVPLVKGDIATLNAEDAELSQILRTAGVGQHYAQSVSFSEGDPLDEEARAAIPHAPSPAVNRFRGRIGLDYSSIFGNGAGAAQDVGVALRADWTRIGGSFWNLTGYTRIRLDSYPSYANNTLTDLLNRTYLLSLTYSNPGSKWVAGFGRLYLPWAVSLSTIDGGYFGRRLNRHTTLGIFAGTTPDPTSWNYNPQEKMAGAFVNFDGGSYEGFHYTTTSGLALTRMGWIPDREFVFFETTLSWKRLVSFYDDFQVEQVHPTPVQPTSSGPEVGRSFMTLRLEPNKYLTFDLNEIYFRDYPTFDIRLIGTGLLDKYLFQGLSAGVRVSNLPFGASVYTDIGRSNRTGDARTSINQMYGLAFNNVYHTGIHADLHYTKFDSAFGSGTYESFSLSRQFRESLRLTLLAGQQNFAASLTNQSKTRFITSSLDWNFSAHYYLGGGVTIYRGGSQNYNQIYFDLGYRF